METSPEYFINNTIPSNDILFGIGGPCIICFGIIWIVTCMTQNNKSNNINNNELNNNNKYQNKKFELLEQNFKKLKDGNPFVFRPAMLDVGLQFIHCYKTPMFDYKLSHSSILQKSYFLGWYNCFVLLGLFYIILTCMDNINNYGNIFRHMDVAFGIILYIHELGFSVLFIYFTTFIGFYIQKAMIYFDDSKYIRQIRIGLTVLQHLYHVLLVFSTAVFVYFRCKHWPITQKLALMAECACLFMKVHSYLDTNNMLYELKKRNGINKKSDDSNHNLFNIINVDIDKLNDTDVDNYLLVYLPKFGLQKAILNNLSLDDKREMLKAINQSFTLKESVYPQNITIWDFVLYTCSPTVVYEPVFPRIQRGNSTLLLSSDIIIRGNIRWKYVIEKGTYISVCIHVLHL